MLSTTGTKGVRLKMKKWDVMSSAYTVWDYTLFGITNTERIFFRLNLLDGKIEYLDNPNNYTRGMFGPDQILMDKDDIYILEINGKRMMRYLIKDNSCHYISLDCQTHLWSNFVKMTKYKNFIYIFLCFENAVKGSYLYQLVQRDKKKMSKLLLGEKSGSRLKNSCCSGQELNILRE